jgi:hypothetical protein
VDGGVTSLLGGGRSEDRGVRTLEVGVGDGVVGGVTAAGAVVGAGGTTTAGAGVRTDVVARGLVVGADGEAVVMFACGSGWLAGGGSTTGADRPDSGPANAASGPVGPAVRLMPTTSM